MGYRGKVVEQHRARQLRRAGRTYAEIAAELGVCKSSVSLWVRDEPTDAGAPPLVRGSNRRQRRKAAEIESCRATAAALLGSLGERDLLVAGTALYAGEGAKTGNAVIFANSDPRMIVLFLTWLRRFFGVDESRLRMRLYLHEGLDLGLAVDFWAELTGIPRTQFRKPYRAAADPSIRRSKHPLGCPAVAYSCAATHRLVMGLVHRLLSPEAINPG